MSAALEFLNKNAGALSAIFSGVVTLATVIYAWLTAKLVSETRQLRMAQTEPRVQVVYRIRDEWINLLDVSIRNVGLGPAYELQFEIRPITASKGTDNLIDALARLNSFKSGLRYLGPGEEFSSFWVNLADGDGTQLEAQLEVICRYKSVVGSAYTTRHVLDISELKGMSKIGSPPLHEVAKHLEEMRKDFHSLATGFKRLRVDAYTQRDRTRERTELEDQLRKQQERRGEA